MSVWFFFIQETYRNPLASVAPIEAIPQNAPLVLTFEDFFQIRHYLTKMPYAEEMSNVFFVKKMSEDFNAIRKLFSKDKNHRQLLLDSRITASLHLSGKNDVDFLYVINDQKDVFSLDILLENFSHRKSQAKGNTVYALTLNDGSKFTVASYNNLLLVSRYSYLVETGMQQIKNPATNLLNQYQLDFSNEKNDEPKRIEVIALMKNFKAFMTPFLNAKPVADLDRFSQVAASVNWVFEFKEKGVAINGNIRPFSSNEILKTYFNNNKITKSQAQEILPENLAYYFRSSIKGMDQVKSKSTDNYFNEYFMPWISDEWLTGKTQIFTRKMKSENFVAYQIKDIKMAQYHLEKLSDSLGLLKKWDYQTYPIRQILLEELPIPFSEGENIKMQNPCYTFINDYVVFTKSSRIIENWIDKILVNRTLARNISFLKMKNESSASEIVELYWNQKTAKKFFRNSFSSKSNYILDQINSWNNFSLGLNGKFKNNELQHNGFLFYEKETEIPIEVKWKLPLHADAQTPPFAIFNKEKGSYDILIQDKENRLYLFNIEGEEEWNVILEGPILSEILGGDFVKNEPPVLVFNTKDKIHQINFEGENQNNFPLKLTSNSVNSLLLADFSEGEYGIFLACENENIYGFDMKGLPFSGWQGIEKVGKISTPLKHVQTENKDYLIAFNDKGDFICFGKDGFKTTEGIGIASTVTQPLCLQVDENSSEVLIADPSGFQRTVNLEGESLGLLQKDAPSPIDQLYTSADIGGDNKTDFAVLENEELQIFYNHKNKFDQYGEFRFLERPDEIFSVQSDNMGKAMIGAVHPEQEQIFLIDKKGNLHQDFPLAGTTPFQLVNLYSDKKEIVLVALKDQVVAYELP